ncbi:MAG: metallophosphoesterase [Thermoleophilaceae bacterium]|nr:metallophosphoesterase [Thermoleophilaceae bacterium]
MEATTVPRRGRTAAAIGAGLLGLALVIGLVVVLAPGDDGPTSASGSGSTLSTTWTDPDGDGALAPGPGEPLRDRTDLAPAARSDRTLATFAQITDAHVRDEESPGRLPVLDRFGEPFVTAFRPQEALSTQVLGATVTALNELDPQAVAVTGDLADSAQANEREQAIAVLGGGRVDPDSGRPGYDGVQAASNPDPFYYRPAVDAPRHRGLLAAAQRPFRSPGLDAPWYLATGNHDVLTQGVVAPTQRVARAATGSRAIAELDEDLELPRSSDSISPELVDRLLSEGLGRTARTPADPERRPLAAEETLARLRGASAARKASATGSGSGTRLDLAFDIGPRARGIVLDTARRDSGSGGFVSPEQLAWLEVELGRAGGRYVVVFSHHPLRAAEGGEAALAVLERNPRVVAAVSGHAHRNAVTPRRGAGGGLWLVETASLADFPQQARAFRLVGTEGGGVALETWMVDHTGGALAPIARELAYLDAQGGRPAGSRGGVGDRNVRLALGRRRADGTSR